MACRFLLATFAALLAGNAAARADEAFDNFQTICVATEAVSANALAAADARGWMPLPQQMLESL
ncbi:MAG TPA: hypothetical protein VHX18_12565, partial [Rhizomicrobium sp.]|nr:hypothetical protein [Rhizomicrobium sp.]